MGGGGKPGCAEINQLYLPVACAVLAEEDVVRRDIPVDNVLLVDCLQGLQYRNHEIQDFFFRQDTFGFQIAGQSLPLEVFHDNIRRVVFLEGVVYVDYPIDVA